MTFTIKVVLGALFILLAVAGLILFFGGGGVDPELEEAVQELEKATSAGNAEGVVRFLSPDFESGREDYEDVSARIRQHLKPGEYESIQIHDRVVSMIDPDHARVECRVRLVRPRALPVPFVEYQVFAEWRKEAEGWKIISAGAERVTLQK